MLKTIGIFLTLCVLSMVGNSLQSLEGCHVCNGLNEEWSDMKCVQNTCDDPYFIKECTYYIPGCYCIDGYVRVNYNGECILPEDCPLTPRCPNLDDVYWSYHPGPDPAYKVPKPECDKIFSGERLL